MRIGVWTHFHISWGERPLGGPNTHSQGMTRGFWKTRESEISDTSSSQIEYQNDKMCWALRIIGPSRLASFWRPYPCYTGSSPSIGGSKILRGGMNFLDPQKPSEEAAFCRIGYLEFQRVFQCSGHQKLRRTFGDVLMSYIIHSNHLQIKVPSLVYRVLKGGCPRGAGIFTYIDPIKNHHSCIWVFPKIGDFPPNHPF